MAIKIHYAVSTPNRFGGYHIYTLCGRENRSFKGDGINDANSWDEVTCKFCLKLRVTHEKREQATEKCKP
jgi:hypothetical protein